MVLLRCTNLCPGVWRPYRGYPRNDRQWFFGTDFTIGYDTALNTLSKLLIRSAIQQLHTNAFLYRSNGSWCRISCINGGIASGAEAVLIPETDTDLMTLENFIKSGYRKSKNSSIVLVAEGEKAGGAFAIANRFERDYPQYDVRVTVLAIFNAEAPKPPRTGFLRAVLVLQLLRHCLDDQQSVMVGIENDEIALVPFNKAIKYDKVLNPKLLDSIRILSS